MKSIVKLYSEKPGEIKKFLELFYSKNIELSSELLWENSYNNPIDIIEIVSCFVDNKDKFKINIWVSLDKDIFINVTDDNVNEFIKYIYERFPN